MHDLAELIGSGYLTTPLPRELGGGGMGLADVCREERQLAYRSPVTALGLHHHLALVGTAAELVMRGAESLGWVLDAAAGGSILADGHAEPGNDIPLLYTSTTAEPVDGGYRFTGRKRLDAATPRWDYLRVCGMDVSRADSPRVVHALLSRQDPGYRLTGSDSDGPCEVDTGCANVMLDGAFVPEERVVAVIPPGVRGVNEFIVYLLTWARLGEAGIYCSMARRILDITVSELRKDTSIALSRSPMMYHAGVQRTIAEMVIELESLEPHLDRLERDWLVGVPRDASWLSRTAIVRDRTLAAVRRVALLAVEARGSMAVSANAELSRLVRATCMAQVLSCEASLTRELVAKSTLGLDFDEQPRWG